MPDDTSRASGGPSAATQLTAPHVAHPDGAGRPMDRLLTVKQARELTADADGRRISEKAFRKLVRAGVVPSWRNPLSGQLRIPESAMRTWMATLADNAPKPSLDEWRNDHTGIDTKAGA